MRNADEYLNRTTVVMCLLVYGLLGLVTDVGDRLGEAKILVWR